jgi:hypothetical protein
MQEKVMKQHVLVVATLAACAVTPALAQFTGLSNGSWTNYQPADAFVNPTLPTSFSWGATVSGSIANRLTFVSTGFDAPLETPFQIGSIRYQNGAVSAAQVQAESVDLHLTVLLDAGPLLDLGNYRFELIGTPNVAGNADASADFVNLPSAFSTSSFDIGGVAYRVRIDGFRNVIGDGFLVSTGSQLHVREQGSATADLFAVVTAERPPGEVAPVPEPSTYALMLAGLGAVGWVSRRRR